MKPFDTNLIVLERFGANGEAAKFYGLLVARWNIQALELLTAIPGKFICPQLSALLGKDVQGIANNQVKEHMLKKGTSI